MHASEFKRIASNAVRGMFLAVGLLAMAAPTLATEQAQERREGRDVKQDTRKDAHKEKVDCRQENNRTALHAADSATPSNWAAAGRDIKY
jgi:hypothetical protein